MENIRVIELFSWVELAGKMLKVRGRKAKALHRAQKEKERVAEASSSSVNPELIPKLLDSDDEDMDVDEEVVVPELEKKRSHHKSVKTGQTLHIPPDVMGLKGVVSCATRNKIRHTALASLISTIISICGGDINKFNLHASTGYK